MISPRNLSLFGFTKRPLCVLLLLAATTLPVYSQQARPQFESRADVASTRVWVSDGRGVHVPGLAREDLRLWVNGEPRRILDLREINLGGEESEATRPKEPGVLLDAVVPPLDPPERASGVSDTAVDSPKGAHYVLLFDLVTRRMNILEAKRAIKVGRDLLGHLSPHDAVAVVLRSPNAGFHVLREFTRDHRVVLEALDEMDNMQFGLGPFSRSGGMLAPLLLLERALQLQNTKTYYVLFFTRGDPDGPFSQSSLDHLRAVARRLRSSGLVVHAINPAALPAADANEPSRPGPLSGPSVSGRPSDPTEARRYLPRDTPNIAGRPSARLWPSPVYASAFANRLSLHALAAGTGGRASFFRSAIPDALAALLSSSKNYYELRFPIEPEDDGVADVRVEVVKRGMRAYCWPDRIEVLG